MSEFALNINGLKTFVSNDNTDKEIPTNLYEQQPEITLNPPLFNKLLNATKEISQNGKMLSQPTTLNLRHELRQSMQIQKVLICYGNPMSH